MPGAVTHPIIRFVFDARDAQASLPPQRRQLLAGLFLALSGFTVAAMMASFKLA